MRPCKLCSYVMPSGRLCGSPALRRRSYCYFHIEQFRRVRRRALRKLMAGRRKVQQRERHLRAKGVVKPPGGKNLIPKSFDREILKDIFGLTHDGMRIYEI